MQNTRQTLYSEQQTKWFWGNQDSLQKLREDILIAAKHDLNILIIGETGTGKEIVARAIHEVRRHRKGLSRKEAPYIAVNSSTIPENLAESVLFGHERGSFTSARERQFGKFELAKRGTLFLDEIQNLSLSVQSKLLRVLQNDGITRLGGQCTIQTDCQFVAATNVPLEYLVESQKFRLDLYFRLTVCPLYVPPLRERKLDFEFICDSLLNKLRQIYQFKAEAIDPEVLERFKNYTWPGNIRELEHTLIYAALRGANTIQSRDLPLHFLKENSAFKSFDFLGIERANLPA